MTSSLHAAVDVVRSGGVVAHATEGVWGFACDPRNYEAVKKVLSIKNRHEEKGLLLLGADIGMFRKLVDRQPTELRVAVEASWPGHHTWILPNTDFPVWISGGRDTVACRVPGHAQARKLVALFGDPIVSTSANFSGQPAITCERQIRCLFASYVDFVLPGKVGEAQGSSTIHGTDGSILRREDGIV